MPEVLDIEKLFQSYWKDSFPMAPANKQAAASHVAFAKYVLLQVEALRASEDEG
jgi:hypothetical protein